MVSAWRGNVEGLQYVIVNKYALFTGPTPITQPTVPRENETTDSPVPGKLCNLETLQYFKFNIGNTDNVVCFQSIRYTAKLSVFMYHQMELCG